MRHDNREPVTAIERKNDYEPENPAQAPAGLQQDLRRGRIRHEAHEVRPDQTRERYGLRRRDRRDGGCPRPDGRQLRREGRRLVVRGGRRAQESLHGQAPLPLPAAPHRLHDHRPFRRGARVQRLARHARHGEAHAHQARGYAPHLARQGQLDPHVRDHPRREVRLRALLHRRTPSTSTSARA